MRVVLCLLFFLNVYFLSDNLIKLFAFAVLLLVLDCPCSVYLCEFSIGSRTGLAPTWCQAISWTNDDKDIDANMRFSGSMG